MKYKYRICLLLSAIALSSPLYADEGEISYKKSLEKWNKSAIREYIMSVKYTAFSPLSGLWDFSVKNGVIHTCRFNGQPADNYKKIAEMFTMENIYKTAVESFVSDKNGPFIIKVIYGKNGLITCVSKTRNPQFKKKIKTDTSYKIEVLGFIPAGG